MIDADGASVHHQMLISRGAVHVLRVCPKLRVQVVGELSDREDTVVRFRVGRPAHARTQEVREVPARLELAGDGREHIFL